MRLYARTSSVVALAGMLTACASGSLDRAPLSPNTAWKPGSYSQTQQASEQTTEANEPLGFDVPAIAELSQMPPSAHIDSNKVFSLPELIDVAQRENPETQLAWNRARQAALAVGMVEATFLPMLSANVVSGYQRTRFPIPDNITNINAIDTELSGTVPILALGWLLFDFGQRNALYEAASEVSFAQNVLFNAAHQKVIRDVTDQFYQYNTARGRTQLAKAALHNQRKIEQAVIQRQKAGLATTIELALARQAVAQATLRLVGHEGTERNIYLSLLSAVGLSPTAELRVAEPENRPLPGAIDPLTEERIQTALTRRPDLVAAYSAVKAAQAGVTAAEADFLPKVYLGAFAAHNKNTFDVAGLPGISQTSSSRSVLIGVTMPIFDGGLRRARVNEARLRAEDAQTSLERQQRAAVREIVAAETILKTALQAAKAASDLVATAETAYDGAFSAYTQGVGTITVATETASQLLVAKQAYSDARNASFAAAANLAFVMGQMTAPRQSWLP